MIVVSRLNKRILSLPVLLVACVSLCKGVESKTLEKKTNSWHTVAQAKSTSKDNQFKAIGPRIKIKNESIEDLWKLVDIADKQKRHRSSIIILEKILKITTQTEGNDSIDRAMVMTILGDSYSLYLNDKIKAIKYAKAALAIKEKILGINNENTLISLISCQRILGDQGKAEDVILIAERALQIYREKTRTNDRFYGTLLRNISFAHESRGRHKQALDIMHEVLINEIALYGKDSREVALSRNQIGKLYSYTGAIRKSEQEYFQSIKILNALEDAEAKIDLAVSRQNLAALYGTTGDYSSADNLYKLACAALEQYYLATQYPPITLLRCLNNEAINEYNLGKVKDATKRLISIIERIKKFGFGNTMNHVYALDSLSLVEAETNEDKLAIQHSLSGLKILANLNSMKSALAANFFNTLATVTSRQKDLPSSVKYMIKAIEINKAIENPSGIMSANYQANLASLYYQMNDFRNTEKTLNKAIPTALAWFTSESFDYTDYRAKELKSQIDSAWMMSYTLTLRSPNAVKLAYYAHTNSQGLLSRIQSRRLSADARNHTLTEDQNKLIIELEAIQKALPYDAILIEFQKFYPYRKLSDQRQSWGYDYKNPHYIAFIVKKTGSVFAVQYGKADSIDSTIKTTLEALSTGTSDSSQLLKILENKIINPLKTHIRTSKTLIIAPDSTLTKVPFRALPSFQNNNWLVHLVTSGRDLTMINQQSSSLGLPIVIANPDFNAKLLNDISLPNNNEYIISEKSYNSINWESLQGSAHEGSEVANILGSKLISGKDANTNTIKELNRPIILHIATHGFYLGSNSKGNIQGNSLNETRIRSIDRKKDIPREGLVLAGANNRNLGGNADKFLTAEEISNLNLKGTELVVLSGCDTGLGDVLIGEGLYGFQRSLAIAGVKSTLLSLWKVDDKATAEFMVRFYKRLKAGESRSDALVATQKEFRDGVVSDPKSKKVWNSPYYWAAWQLVGDWRPINGL